MITGPELELFERSVARAVEGRTGAALDDELLALGWPDALATDPATAVPVLFRRQGAANSTSSALGMVVTAALTGDPMGGPVVLPALGGAVPPGHAIAVDGAVEVEVEVDGLIAGRRGSETTMLVPTEGGTVAVAAVDVAVTPVGGIDPAFGLRRVSGRARGEPVYSGDTAWTVAVAHARLSLGYELTGASRRMLDLACSHAVERIQFGRPIASFQAVRHRLAETLVAVEAAEAVLADAWAAPDGALPLAAKALAGRAARTAARHCQQVLAGIGFTAEHPFHRYLRRTLLIDQLFGSSAALTEQLGAILIGSGRLPDMPAL